MAHQVSVFAENKPGRIEKITRILAEARINIRAITISSANGFGVVKILVDQPQRAFEVLREHGVPVYLQEVIAVILDDIPGGLHKVAKVLAENGINIEDAYGFVVERGKTAVLVIQVEHEPQAQSVLERNGFVLLSDEEIYKL
ncbi:ACT domain-containing protein [Candidatus Caldatribacterium sp.]|uniref:ACT domain-containing protein n=1 Tax=Candidatus Caldatribacterium sp. TaxID=2282143 RepID=UPI00299472B8|nr:ACT domain-containing protein [Candidatus Caldatribacterium sp.]MDW8081404.1 ACT domain-containing protein [Candidatus Calescibacterium sp.]